MSGGSILFAGVGGQGILLASEITSYALMEAGFDIKKSEVHGMAQRGGSVTAQLKYGQKVYSPLIGAGGADIMAAFELMESLRYMPMLSADSRVIVNTQKILPPSVAAGQQKYPDGVIETLKGRGLSVFPVNAFDIAREVGELRSANMVLVGALSSFVSVSADNFIDVINKRVKKGFEKVNVEAFKRGRALTEG
jgi:indolepyruvate ferredoxin oxidoreductase beta subunit